MRSIVQTLGRNDRSSALERAMRGDAEVDRQEVVGEMAERIAWAFVELFDRPETRDAERAYLDARDVEEGCQLLLSIRERLDERERKCYTIFYEEGRTNEEMAAALGISTRSEQRVGQRIRATIERQARSRK